MPTSEYSSRGRSFQRLAQHGIGAASAIDICGDEGAHASVEGLADHADVALVIQHLAEVHEFAAAPGAVCCLSDVHGRK
jgi:hypothetical protein